MGQLLNPTTKAFGKDAVGMKLAKSAFGRDAVAMKPAKEIWAKGADGWKRTYSTPTGTLSGGGPDARALAGGTGRAAVSVTATPGGVNSGNLSYVFTRSGGGNNYNYSASGNVLLAYYDFAVANGQTQSLPSEQVYCDITDLDTGAVYRTDNITVGPLSMTNTTPAFTPHTNTYTSGSGTEYVPAGATTLTIRRVGGGGGGGNGIYNSGTGITKGGNGGGSGAYTPQTIAIAPGDAGAPIYWSVGAGTSGWPNIGGTSATTGSVVAGSVSGSAVGGAGGASGAQSVAGAGVGGNPNGNNGTSGGNDVAGNGGASPYGGYGKGGNGSLGGGSAGGAGAIIFEWG